MKRVIQGLLAIGNWCETMYFSTCVVYRIVYKICKAIDQLVVVMIDCFMFNFCTTFDIDVNGGESDMKKIRESFYYGEEMLQ